MLFRSYPYKLSVASEAKPGETVTASSEVIVKPFERFSIEMHPTSLSDGGAADLMIRNEGNVEGIYSLRGRDPANEIQFTGEHGRIRAPSGGIVKQRITIKARKRSLLGTAQTLPFEIHVTSSNDVRQTRTGQLKVNPIIPMWIAPLLGGLLTICLIGVVLLRWLIPGPQVTPPGIATLDPVIIIAGQTATQAAQETALAGMITPTFMPTGIPTNTPTFTPTETPTSTSTSTPTATPTFTPTEQISGFPDTWISVYEVPVASLVSHAISRLVISRVDQDTATFSVCRCNSASCSGQIELDPPKVIANLKGDEFVADTPFNVAKDQTWIVKAIKVGNNLLVTVQETLPNGTKHSEPFEMKSSFDRLGRVLLSCEAPVFKLP